MMGIQGVFDRVASHLMTQKARAHNGKGCSYYAPDGTKCAVGCLIAHSAYKSSLEGHRVGSHDVREALRMSGVPTDSNTMIMLSRLQSLHDHWPINQWRDELRDIAHWCGLHADAVYHPERFALRQMRHSYEKPWLDELRPMHEQVVRVHVDPKTGWRTPIYEPIHPYWDEGLTGKLHHPKFHDDAHEKAERDAMYAAMDACKKAATVERKTLTPAPELIT